MTSQTSVPPARSSVPLADVERAYRDALGTTGTVVDFDISSLDRLGVPVTSCSLVVDGTIAHQGNGYAATAQAAAVSGLGELAEGVVSEQGLRRLEQQSATRAELVRRLGEDGVVDPRLLCLPAGCGYDDDQRLTWVPLLRLADGASVQVPVEFVASEPAELPAGQARTLVVPITNGLGAGLDHERAVSHGLGEIVQRHTNGLRFRALDRLSPVIDPAGLPRSVADLLARFAEQGIEVSLKHAGTELGMFSCYAVAVDVELADPIRLTACGEAADPAPETAMIKAVLEYANSRSRKAFCFGANPKIPDVAPSAYWDGLPTTAGEPRAVAAMQAWARLAPEQLRELTAPDLSRTVALAEVRPAFSEPDAATLDRQLEAFGGHDVLVHRSATGDVRTAKTIVTGLEVETLSYGRIGEAGCRAALEADLGLVRVDTSPSGSHLHRVCLRGDAEERLGGPVWFSYDRAAEIVGARYPLYREPPRHSVAVGVSPAPADRGVRLS